MTVEVRAATPADASAVLALCLRAHAEALETCPVLPEPDQNMVLAGVALSIREGFAFVALKEGKMIGSIGGFPMQHWYSPKYFVSEGWWYVLPKHRGWRVASMLMQALQGRTDQCGLPVFVWGLSIPGKLRALSRMSRRLGFTHAGLSLIHQAP